MSELTTSAPSAAPPAQEQAPISVSATASYHIAHKPDHAQYKPGVPEHPSDTQQAAQDTPQADAQPAAATEQAEKPYNARETLQTVQKHIPDVDMRSLTLAEGLISRSLSAAESNPITPEALAEGQKHCYEFLQSKHGAKVDTIIDYARKELAHLTAKMPGLPHILEKSGRGNDPWLVDQLAQMHVKRQYSTRK